MSLAFLNLNPMELIIIAIVGLLLFGRRLPEVGKNLGRSIVEFKKGLSSAGETETKETIAPAPENKAAVPPAAP
ncbi:MAG: twin-arginine translocase TatA/TatE family subunit, partial [Phycisphaerae bacterium]